MSAEMLRRAAALMRERAEAATPGRWGSVLGEITVGEPDAVDYREVAVAVIGPRGDDRQDFNAEHIASWHPAVALAVADWLDWEAREAERFQAQTLAPRCMVSRRALTVAHTYLGEGA